jgi:hypothetical protein
MQSSIRRFWIRLTADRKRFGILCAALMIGLLLWARLIVVSQPPRMALAEPTDASATASTTGENSPGAAGADNAKPGKRTGSRADGSPISVELSAKPSHDPFVISPIYFPKPTPIAQTIELRPKSEAEPVEDSMQIAARIAAHRRAVVERMKLEAAFGNSWAVIDGRKYRVGDQIGRLAGSEIWFELVEIRQRSVILECEGRQFELQMATPGS